MGPFVWTFLRKNAFIIKGHELEKVIFENKLKPQKKKIIINKNKKVVLVLFS